MATCKECIHYDICLFHITGNENEFCGHFIYTADVVPKSETAREIFAEIEDLFFDKYLLGNITASLFEDKYAELKDKYCGKDTNVPTKTEGSPDTNVGNK